MSHIGGAVDLPTTPLEPAALQAAGPVAEMGSTSPLDPAATIVQPTVAGDTVSLESLIRRFGSEAALTMVTAVGRVDVSLPDGDSFGSGVVLAWGNRQYVLTAAHVVETRSGAQVPEFTVKFLSFRADGTSLQYEVGGTPYEVRRIIGRSAFGGRDLAMLELKRPVQETAGVALPSAQPGVGEEVVIAGFGYRNGVSRHRHLGYSAIDRLRQVYSGSSTRRTHPLVGEHLVYRFDEREAAAARGDSGGPDYLIRGGRVAVMGIHSFFGSVRDEPQAPVLGEENWSVQLTPEVAARIQALIPVVPQVQMEIGVRVFNDGEDFPCFGAEWRATMEVNGHAFAWTRGVSERSDPYWLDETFVVTSGERVHVKFWGEEIDEGSLFCGPNEIIARFDDTFTIPAADGQVRSVGRARNRDTDYELVVKVEQKWVGKGRGIGGPGGGEGSPATGGDVHIVPGTLDVDVYQDLYVFQERSGANQLVPFTPGRGFGDPVASHIAPTAINGEFNNVAVGDFDGDRRDDLVFHDSRSGLNRWFFGRGDGSYEYLPLRIEVTAVNGGMDHMVAGDFDGDGLDDLLFHDTLTGVNRWYFGRRDRTFEYRPDLIGRLGVNHEFDHLTVGDFNGDGRDDLLFHASGSGNNRWAYGREDRQIQFDSSPKIALHYVNTVFDHVTAGDFNGDGLDDLLFFDVQSGFNRWFMATPNGAYRIADNVLDPGELDSMEVVTTSDFDRDGRSDVVFYDADGGWPRHFSGMNIRASLPPQLDLLGNKGVNGFSNLASGDFNRDGAADLIFHAIASGQNRWAFGRSGAGFNFDANSRIGQPAVNSEFAHVVVGDYNGDGYDDVLFHALRSGNNRWFFSRADGNFDSYINPIDARGVNGEFDHVVAGDFNGDGVDDVLFHASYSGNNRWWFGRRDGVSSALETQLIASSALNHEFNNVVAGDFDGDGADDLLFHATRSGNNRWVFGRRGGGFETFFDQSQPLIGQAGINHEYSHVVAGDLNGDGRDDLLFYAQGTGHTRRAYGRADKRFDFDPDFRIPPGLVQGSHFLAAGDFNRDGVADLFFLHAASGTNVTVYSEPPPPPVPSPPEAGEVVVIVPPPVQRPTLRQLADGIGFHRGNRFYLDANVDGAWNQVTGGDCLQTLGAPGDTPLVGDWDGDGEDDLGFHRGNRFYLDLNGNGTWDRETGGDIIFTFGAPGDTPLVGDWDGDGDDDLGFHRGNRFYLDWNDNGKWDGAAVDRVFTLGAPGDTPLVGDWDGDGDDDLGFHRGHRFYLDQNGNGAWNGERGGDKVLIFGAPWDRPLIGDWDGDGDDDVGFHRGNRFYLDQNGNGKWESAHDRYFSFGAIGDTPLVGRWRKRLVILPVVRPAPIPDILR